MAINFRSGRYPVISETKVSKFDSHNLDSPCACHSSCKASKITAARRDLRYMFCSTQGKTAQMLSTDIISIIEVSTY